MRSGASDDSPLVTEKRLIHPFRWLPGCCLETGTPSVKGDADRCVLHLLLDVFKTFASEWSAGRRKCVASLGSAGWYASRRFRRVTMNYLTPEEIRLFWGRVPQKCYAFFLTSFVRGLRIEELPEMSRPIWTGTRGKYFLKET